MPGNPLSDELLGEILRGCEAAISGPWELVPATEHHGPYIVGPAGDVADLYTMSNPTAASILNGGTSYPIPFADADANAAHIARLDPQTVSALVTELIERRKAGTFAEGIEAAAKWADGQVSETVKPGHMQYTEEGIGWWIPETTSTRLLNPKEVAASLRSLTPNKDTTS